MKSLAITKPTLFTKSTSPKNTKDSILISTVLPKCTNWKTLRKSRKKDTLPCSITNSNKSRITKEKLNNRKKKPMKKSLANARKRIKSMAACTRLWPLSPLISSSSCSYWPTPLLLQHTLMTRVTQRQMFLKCSMSSSPGPSSLRW